MLDTKNCAQKLDVKTSADSAKEGRLKENVRQLRKKKRQYLRKRLYNN